MDEHMKLLTAVYERQGQTLAKLDTIDARLTNHHRRLKKVERVTGPVVALFSFAGVLAVGAWNWITRK